VSRPAKSERLFDHEGTKTQRNYRLKFSFPECLRDFVVKSASLVRGADCACCRFASQFDPVPFPFRFTRIPLVFPVKQRVPSRFPRPRLAQPAPRETNPVPMFVSRPDLQAIPACRGSFSPLCEKRIPTRRGSHLHRPRSVRSATTGDKYARRRA
jgi:hypothetical protein